MTAHPAVTRLFLATIAIAHGTACSADVQLAVRDRDGATDASAVTLDAADTDAALRASATIVAVANTDNASDPRAFPTRFDVELTREGRAVVGATVAVESAAETISLAPSSPGHYAATAPSYQRSYTLRIGTGGTQLVFGSVQGPQIHTFLEPAVGEVLRADAARVFRWTPASAPAASVRSDELAPTAIADTGTFTLPAAATRGTPGTLRPETFRLARSTVVALPLATDSALRIEVQNALPFVIDAR